jgi:hypothetical protein
LLALQTGKGLTSSLFAGFYDDFVEGTFGTVRKDVKRPLSNFSFGFRTKVVAKVPSSTGYLVEVSQKVTDR